MSGCHQGEAKGDCHREAACHLFLAPGVGVFWGLQYRQTQVMVGAVIVRSHSWASLISAERLCSHALGPSGLGS